MRQLQFLKKFSKITQYVFPNIFFGMILHYAYIIYDIGMALIWKGHVGWELDQNIVPL